MLRQIVQWIGIALMLTGGGLIAVGASPPGAQALLFGAIIFLAVRYERWRDRARPPSADAAWQSTGERFEDPGSGKTVEVEYNSRTGERRYRTSNDG